MKRRNFLTAILAALGAGGSLRLHSRQSGVPDLPVPAPSTCDVCAGAGWLRQRNQNPVWCPSCELGHYGKFVMLNNRAQRL